ncbi:MAG: tetratricopeptide repeat protein [Nitrospinota bacterium]
MRYIISTLMFLGFLLAVPAAAESVLDAPAGADKAAAMHNSAGVAAYKAGNWSEAASHFKEAVAIDKKLAEAHYNLALSLHKMGRHGEASGHFQHALKYGKNNKGITESKTLKAHTQ